jgi:putative transposase
MVHGFLYLVAVMDWVSRYVLAWRVSNLLDSSFCVEALEDALSQGRPEIFNTDQGSQLTGDLMATPCTRSTSRKSAEARRSIAAYFEFYNERLHQALGYRAPRQVFEEALRVVKFRRGRKTAGADRELAAQIRD